MSTLRVDTIQNAAGTNSPISVPGTAKAWVNFNGTGTVAIRASYNVSSITDNGTGDYTVNFTNALADANYSVGLGNSVYSASSYRWTYVSTLATDSVIIKALNNGTGFDTDQVLVQVFR